MINVTIPKPPPHYDLQVRQPGLSFLASNPNPNGNHWAQHRHWKEIHQDLYQSLGGICSYCATFTPRRSGNSGIDHTSIDHFVPKGIDHALAYEWSNFRLCRSQLNHRKDSYQDVIDPYVVVTGHFRLSFVNFFIFPDDSLDVRQKGEIIQCLDRLELNKDDAYINERARAVYSYVEKRLSFQDLEKYFPFVATELKAQDFDNNFLPDYCKALAVPKLRTVLITQGVLDR